MPSFLFTLMLISKTDRSKSPAIHIKVGVAFWLGVYLLRLLGTRYRFCNLAAELTGLYWSYGSMLGRQYYIMEPDDDGDEGELLVCASCRVWHWR